MIRGCDPGFGPAREQGPAARAALRSRVREQMPLPRTVGQPHRLGADRRSRERRSLRSRAYEGAHCGLLRKVLAPRRAQRQGGPIVSEWIYSDLLGRRKKPSELRRAFPLGRDRVGVRGPQWGPKYSHACIRGMHATWAIGADPARVCGPARGECPEHEATGGTNNSVQVLVYSPRKHS